MNLTRWLARALFVSSTLFGAAGCPAALDDNFTTAPADSSGGRSSSAGANAQGGAVNTDAGAAGADSGGTTTTGGAVATGGTINLGMAGGSAGAPDSAGATGEGGDTAVAPCSTCSAAECCDGTCVDLQIDPDNCHTCGHVCPGTTCDAGSCTNTCAQGKLDCNHNVVDGCETNPAIDPANCGNCGIACGFQLECVDGECVCPKGTADCDGIKPNGCETDLTSDGASCGACGKACNSQEICVAGKCQCASGFADCDGLPDNGCEASLTDPHTCGSCAFDCGVHSQCIGSGSCQCTSGYLDCDVATAGCETPVTTPNHCGSCAVSCQSPTPACDGTSCSSGCGALTACGGSCVDTQQDPQNCGGCGKPVGANQICTGGKATCVAGFSDCDGNPNDCEVNTQVDAQHCGGCGTICKPGAICNGGSCGCAPTTPNDCGSACRQCCDDTQCSDGDSCTADSCNNGICSSGAACAGGGLCCAGTGCFECCGDTDCTGGKVCSANKCITLVCTAPQIACNSKCIDPATNAKNCGSCGNDCGLGRSCAASSCTPKWLPTANPLGGFAAREKSAYAALGSKVFVWGGANDVGTALGDGAIYDPASDSLAAVVGAGSAPSARVLATAVWTGTVMVVWGGGDTAGKLDLNSGGRYDPTTGTWQATSLLGAPSGRRGAYGVWTGSRVLFYGGVDKSGVASPSLDLYDPVNDVWSTTTATRPFGRTDPTVGWSGSRLYIYGGVSGGVASQSTFAYDVGTKTWLHLSDGPTARYGALGGWDGTYFTAWSGQSPLKNDGKVYQPSTDKWFLMQALGQPALRWAPNRQTGWSARIKPGATLIVGGLGGTASTFFTGGAIYNSSINTWSAVSNWPSGVSHLWGVGVWTGTDFVVWGGRAGTTAALTSVGERYRP